MSGIGTVVPRLPRGAWILLGGDALSAVGSGLTLPFFLVYLHRVRGVDLELAGLALSTVAVASLFGNALGGALSDRFGPRRALVLGLLVASAGAVSLAGVREAWHAFAAAATVGLGAGVVWPVQDGLLASLVTPEQRSSAFSVRHGTLNAGLGLGSVAAALLVETSSPRTFELLYVLDGLSFLAFVPLLLALGDVPGPAREERAGGGYREVLRDRTFLRLWALMALLVAAGYAQYHAAFPAWAMGAGGLSAGALGVAFAANTLGVVLLQLVALRVSSGRRRTRGILVACAFWAGGWVVTLLAGGLGGGLAAVIALASAMGLLAVGETFLTPAVSPLVNDLAPERLRGRYNGAFTMAWTSGFIVGPMLSGFAFAAGLGHVLLLGLVALCGAAGLAALRLERRLPVAANLVPARDPRPEPQRGREPLREPLAARP